MSFISNDNVVAVAVAADPPPQGPPAQILMRSQDEFQDQNRAPALHPPAPAKRQRTTDQDVSAADAADAADAAVRVVEVAAAGKEQAASVDDCAAGNECPICMETWTSAGPFQVVALLCGHLFCRQCVSKWIGLQKPTSNRTLGAKIEVACPTCKTGSSAALKKVERRKFLPLLGLTRRPLSVRDSDELISLRTDREKHLSQITLLTQQKEKSAYDHQNMLMAYRGLERKQDDLLKEVLGLKGQIHHLTSKNAQLSAQIMATQAAFSKSSFTIRSSLPLPATCSNSTLTRPVLKFKIKTMAESCRKCVISPQNNCLLIAVSFVKALAGTPFFPGSTPISSSSSSSPCPPTNIYGLLRVSLVDIECRAFIPNLHSAPIRDIVCSPHSQDFILTASTDKTMKLVRIDSRSVVQSFTCSHPVWSCAFDVNSQRLVYAGLSNNHVVIFDLRTSPSSPLKIVNNISFPPKGVHTLITTRAYPGLLFAGCMGGIFMVEMEINQEDGEQATPSSSSLSSSEEVISLQQHQSVPLKTTTQELTKSGGGGCTSFHFDVASRTFLSVWRVSLANGVMKNILHRYCQQTKSFLQANTEYTLRCSQKALVPACFWSVASSDSGNDGVKDGDTEMGESDINDNTNDSNDNDTTDGKSWCFTLENPKELIDFDPSWMSFLIYQEEAASLTSSGPAATRFHGYLETTNIISLFQLQARFGGPIAGSSSSDIDIKFENRLHRGISRQEAIESCRKSPRLGGPYEFDRLAVRGNKNIPNGMKSQDETNVFDHFICNADESTSSILFKAPESLVNLFPKAIRLDNNYITQPQSKSSSTSLQQLSFTDLHCCEMKLHGRERWLAAVVGQIVFVFAWSGGGNL